MLYIIWAILNLGLFLYFLYLIIVTGKLLGKKIGAFAAFFLILATCSFMCQPAHNDDNSGQEVPKWYFSNADSLDKSSIVSLDPVNIHNQPMAKNYIGVKYGRDKVSGSNLPIEAYTVLSGWQLGTKWKPNDIDLQPVGNNNKFKYTVKGSMTWYILGFAIYVQQQEYSGSIVLK